jgi:hypothetical protein
MAKIVPMTLAWQGKGALMKMLVFALITALLMTSGCASLPELSNQVVQAKMAGNEGVTKVYPVSVNQAWEITETVFRWEKCDAVKENRQENYMITSTGMKMVAFGSVMGVWLEPSDESSTKVTVVTRRRVEKDFFTKLDAPTFFERFEKGLEIVKEGKKLPVVPPAK